MRRQARQTFVLAALVIAAGVLGYGFVTLRASSARASTQMVPVVPTPSSAPARAATTQPSATTAGATVPDASPPVLDEAALMTELRSLRAVAPEQALALARRGNEAFPNGKDGAERGWIIVRCLDDLRRFHDAQAEARAMREQYPGTSWTEDVERHTLVYPLDQPSREAQQAAVP